MDVVGGGEGERETLGEAEEGAEVGGGNSTGAIYAARIRKAHSQEWLCYREIPGFEIERVREHFVQPSDSIFFPNFYFRVSISAFRCVEGDEAIAVGGDFVERDGAFVEVAKSDEAAEVGIAGDAFG